MRILILLYQAKLKLFSSEHSEDGSLFNLLIIRLIAISDSYARIKLSYNRGSCIGVVIHDSISQSKRFGVVALYRTSK